MKEALNKIVEMIAMVHSKILALNYAYEMHFSDKQLHFLVIGFLGMALIFAIYPIFKWLAKKDCIMTITWIYVFTLIIVITFAIEIGQKVSHTGTMDFADIVFGTVGFMAMYLIFVSIRQLVKMVVRLVQKSSSK